MTPNRDSLLRPKASVASETDMRGFEDAFHGCVCHIFVTGAPVTLCGLPRAEQPRHRPVGGPIYAMAQETHCPDCGSPRCPKCAAKGRLDG